MIGSIKEFIADLQPRQRFLAVAIMAILFVVILNFFLTPEAPVNTAQMVLPVKNKAADPPVMPQGHQAEAVVKDPFAIPPQYQKKDEPPAVSQPQDKSFMAENNENKAIPNLTGIVGSADKQLAILEYQTESRAYQVNDVIGPYRITAIYDQSVVLAGPNGNQTLTLGRW